MEARINMKTTLRVLGLVVGTIGLVPAGMLAMTLFISPGESIPPWAGFVGLAWTAWTGWAWWPMK